MNFKKIGLFAAATLVVASAAFASNFRAADTIYLPSAGHISSSTFTFVTDVVITNLSTSKVVVQVAYGDTGLAADNSQITKNLKTLATFNPGERRLISDITNAVFPEKNEKLGFLVFFACKEGGNCSDCDANPADCHLITVQGRIYSYPIGKPTGPTTGQLFVGYPWYSFVSQNDAALGLDKVFIVGVRQEGVAGTSGYRSNFGILNASQDYESDIKVSLYNADGTLFLANTYTLKALQHLQPSVASQFPGFATNNTAGYMVVQQIASRLVPGGCAACSPGFFAFGSVLDNQTSDPTTLETVYTQALDIRCVYGTKADKHPIRK